MKTLTNEERGQLMFEASIHTHVVAFLDDCGCWINLEFFCNYEAADAALDRWADRYPNAWVDVKSI